MKVTLNRLARTPALLVLLFLPSIALAQQIPASELQLPWELIRSQALRRAPESGTIPAQDTRVGRIQWRRLNTGSAENGERLELDLSEGSYTLEELNIDATSAETGASNAGPSSSTAARPTLPRQFGRAVEIGRAPSSGRINDSLQVSYAPKTISFSQSTPFRLNVKKLKYIGEYDWNEGEDLWADISGISFELDRAVEAVVEAQVETGPNGRPRIKAIKPELRLDHSKLKINCDAIQISLGEVTTGQFSSGPELEKFIRDAACRHLEEQKEKIWAENSPKLHDLIQGKLLPELLAQVNQSIGSAYDDVQKSAVEFAIAGLAFTETGVRIGVGPEGSDCAFDPRARPRMMLQDEAMILMGERDIQALIDKTLPGSFDIPGWGELRVDAPVKGSKNPKITLLRPSWSGGTAAIEVEVQGTLNEIPDQRLPGYAAIARPPVKAQGKLRFKPVVKDGQVTLELFRDLELKITDASNQQVTLKQDQYGGRISLPESTLQSLSEGLLVHHSDGKLVSQASKAVFNTRTRSLTDLAVREDDQIWTADGIAQVGTLRDDGTIEDLKGKPMADLKITEKRSASLGNGKTLTILGRPQLKLKPGGRIEAEFEVDLDPSTAPALRDLEDVLTEEVCVGSDSTVEFIPSLSRMGGSMKTVKCPPYVAKASKRLSHITAKVRAGVRLESRGGKLEVVLEKINPIDVKDTNLGAAKNTALGSLGDAYYWFSDSGVREKAMESLNSTIQKELQSFQDKPLGQPALSDIPGWQTFAARNELWTSRITTSDGQLALVYQFKDRQQGVTYSTTQADSWLADKLLTGASDAQRATADELMRLAHVRDAAVREDPTDGRPRLEIRLAEGPAPVQVAPVGLPK